jgi:hypothetical protein
MPGFLPGPVSLPTAVPFLIHASDRACWFGALVVAAAQRGSCLAAMKTLAVVEVHDEAVGEKPQDPAGAENSAATTLILDVASKKAPLGDAAQVHDDQDATVRKPALADSVRTDLLRLVN